MLLILTKFIWSSKTDDIYYWIIKVFAIGVRGHSWAEHLISLCILDNRQEQIILSYAAKMNTVACNADILSYGFH